MTIAPTKLFSLSIGTASGELGELCTGITRWHIEILRLIQDVSHLNRLLCRHCATERRCWSRSNYWILSPLLDIWLRRIMDRDSSKAISFGLKKYAEFSLADACRVRQHCAENRFEFAGRT